MNETFTPPIVDADPDANITDLLEERVKATPDDALFALPTAEGGWSDVTAAEFHRQVVGLAKGFMAAGIKRGDKIAEAGATDTTSPRLHFEVRRRGTPVDPLQYLPAP